jgi:hypothetical protein
MLILADDSTEFVSAGVSYDELLERYGLGELARSPKVTVYPGVYLEGPSSG